MSEREFKFYPEDFGHLTVKVEHMDLDFEVFDDHTVVQSKLHVEALEDIKELELNAKKLEVLECSHEYDYRQDEDMMVVKVEAAKGEKVVIESKTVCRPTKHILEGIYFDETPEGAPPQQITQCQQWGFQRIVPCIDDMTAKCTYRTTITADERYTNLISNGDVVVERESAGEGRERIVYDNMITPMATYLFFLGCGTYATFEKEFVYPDGDKFMLELLVPPESDETVARHALDVIHDAIMWIYLFTGPDKYANWERSLEIKAKMEKGEDCSELIKGMNFGYKYTGTVYREIGMQNSDFGGMENVGNTTITTNRIMPFPEMTDGSFEYMVQVKVHEFYHNLNGSEVTGRSPFEIWLNEAVTVFIEQEYHEFLFGEDYSRLDRVLTLLAPVGGTFAGDDSVTSMPIEPDGFNDPNELITGVTYVKAPEFVGMIESLMGEEVFVKGLDLYHTRYKHGNASRAQWIEAMEEASGMDFQRMAQVWLKQASYPKVRVERLWDDGRFVLKLKQEGFEEGMHWEFPFVAALCREDGSVIEEKMLRVMEVESEMVFEGVEEPAFVSLNRGYKFYGKVFCEVDEEELYLAARKDGDIAARYMAFYRLSEGEKMRILEGGEVSEKFVDLFFELLDDGELMERVGSSMVAIFEQVEDPRFAHEYQKLYDCVKAIQKAVAVKNEGRLKELYSEYAEKKFEGTYVEKEAGAIKARQVKNTCLGLLARLDNEEVWKMIKAQFDGAQCATDRVVAFSMYLNSSAPDKMEMLRAYQQEVSGNLVSWESFLGVVAGVSSDDVVDIVREVEKSDSFRIEQANDQRALYCRFAMNRKKSLLTEAGREFLREKIGQLAKVNEYSTGYLLKVFGNIDKIAEEHQAELVDVLMKVRDELSQEETPSVYNTIERILKGSPKGVQKWEENKK